MEINTKMVYGVFSGQYSDWHVHGYFEDKVAAQKYCAKKNLHKENYDDDEEESWYSHHTYYVKDIPNLINNNYDTSDVKLRYYHTVMFDIGKGMRKDPDGYSFYTGTQKEPYAEYNSFTKETGWVRFCFDCENRDKAEKIAQDKYAMFMNLYHESGSYNLAAESMGIRSILEPIEIHTET